MLNLGGLGFTFSAEDRGLKGALRSGATGFAKLGDSASAFGKDTKSALSGMSGAFKPFESSTMGAMAARTHDFTDGLKKGFTSVGGSVVDVGRKLGDFTASGIRKMGELTSSVTSFAAAIGSRAIATGIRAASSAVQGMAGRAVSAIQGLTAAPSNLTTSMEAEMQHHAEAARRIGTNYGFAGAELQRFTRRTAGMADSLNIGDEAAAQAARGFMEAGAEFRAVGLGSASDVARFSAVTGTSADLLRNSMLQARREFGFNDEQLRTLMHSTVAYGRFSGDVTGNVNAMADTMNQLRQAAAQSGEAIDPARLATFAQGTQRAAAALFVFSQNSDDARAGANQISTAILGAQREMQGLLAGTTDDIPQFAQELGMATGDIGHAFDLMRAGPDGMIQGLAQMAQAAHDSGRPMGASMNNLLQRMSTALGPEAANRIQTFVQNIIEHGSANVESAMSTVSQAQNLHTIAAAHSTGRTLQEEYDRMQQGFIMGFRGISRHAVGPFMRDTSQAFSQFNGMLRDVVAEGGPIGSLVERLSLVHQMGALALLPPDARPFAAAFGSLFSEMAPALGALGSMGFRLGMLANPLAIIGVALGFVAVQFGAIFLRTRNAGEAFTILQGKVSDFANTAVTFVESLVPTIVRAIPLVLGAFARLIQIAVPAALRITVAIYRGLGQIGMQIVEWAATFDWGGFARTLFTALGEALRSAAGVGASVLGALASVFSRIDFGRLAGALVEGIGSLFAMLGRVDFGGMMGRASSISTGLGEMLSGALRAIQIAPLVTSLLRVVERVWLAVAAVLPGMVRGLGTIVASGMPVVGEALQSIFRGYAKFIADFDFTQIVNPIVDGFVDAATAIVGGLPGLSHSLMSGFLSMADAIASGPFISRVLDTLQHILSRAITYLTTAALPAFMGVFENVYGALPRVLSSIIELVGNTLEGLPSRIGALMAQGGREIGAAMPGLIRRGLDLAVDMISQIPGLVWQAIGRVPAIIAGIGPMIVRAIGGMRDIILGILEGIRSWLVTRFPQAAGIINTVFGGISSFITGISTTMQTVLGAVWTAISVWVSTVVAITRAAFDYLGQALSGLVQLVSITASAISGAFSVAWTAVMGAAQTAWLWIDTNVFSPLRGAWESVVTFMRTHFGTEIDAIQTAFGGVVSWFETQIGRVQGVFTSIGSAASRLNPFANAAPAPTPAPNPTPPPARPPTIPTPTPAAAAVTPAAAVRAPAVAAALPSLDFGSLGSRGSAAVTAAATGAQTSFTNITGTSQAAAEGMAVAFEGTRDRVVAVFSTIQAAATGEAGAFAAIRTGATTTMDHIVSTTSVAMAGVVTAFQQNVDAMVIGVVNLFSTAVVTGITTSFQAGFQSVLNFVRTTFTTQLTEAFMQTVNMLKAQFANMVISILDVTDSLFAGLANQMQTLGTLVARITNTATTLQAHLQSATVAAGGGVTDARAHDLGTRDAALNDLYNAIMFPHWYEQDFKNLYTAKMDALIQAVQSTRGAPAAPSGGGGTTSTDTRALARSRLQAATPDRQVTDANGTPRG